jgi:hypothetical protein
VSQDHTASPNKDDPNSGATFMVILLSTVFCLATVWVLQGYFEYAQRKEVEAKVVNVTPANLARSRQDDAARLSGYRWIDRESGVVSIPIEDAMQLVVERAGD